MPRKRNYCDFCGKAADEVERLVPGPCYICNECIDRLHEMIHGTTPKFPSGRLPKGPRNVIPFGRPVPE